MLQYLNKRKFLITGESPPGGTLNKYYTRHCLKHPLAAIALHSQLLLTRQYLEKTNVLIFCESANSPQGNKLLLTFSRRGSFVFAIVFLRAITVVSKPSTSIKRTLIGCERLKASFEPIVHKVTNYVNVFLRYLTVVS